MLVSGNLIKYPKWMAELLQLVWRLSWPILITRASPVRPIRGYYYLMSNKCHTRPYVTFLSHFLPSQSPCRSHSKEFLLRGRGEREGRTKEGREIRANELRMQKLAHSCRHGCAQKFFDYHHRPETERWNGTEVWGKGGGKLVETFGKFPFPPWESYLRR